MITRKNVASAVRTDAIYDGTIKLTPKFAFANVPVSTTDENIVTAVGGKKIRVLEYAIMAGVTATNITFNSKSGGVGTAISMLFAQAANGGAAPGYSPIGKFETISGEGLTVTTGAGSTVGVMITYVEV